MDTPFTADGVSPSVARRVLCFISRVKDIAGHRRSSRPQNVVNAQLKNSWARVVLATTLMACLHYSRGDLQDSLPCVLRNAQNAFICSVHFSSTLDLVDLNRRENCKLVPTILFFLKHSKIAQALFIREHLRDSAECAGFFIFYFWKNVNSDRNNRSCEFKGFAEETKEIRAGLFAGRIALASAQEDDCALNTFNIAFY